MGGLQNPIDSVLPAKVYNVAQQMKNIKSYCGERCSLDAFEYQNRLQIFYSVKSIVLVIEKSLLLYIIFNNW